jgi:tellurite resistance protein TehA-like permease
MPRLMPRHASMVFLRIFFRLTAKLIILYSPATGSISLLFQNFPYTTGSRTFKIFTLIFFFLNLALFILFTIITAARYILFPKIWSLMIRHSVQGLYIGCFPMGATTLINVSVRTIYQDYGFGGKSFLYAMWGLWWVDAAISCLCVWGMAQIMYASLFTEHIFTRANTCLEHTRFTRQRHSLETMLPVWLLPIVTFVVAASSGGILVGPLQEFSPSHALITVVVSIFMVTIGLSLSFMILTIYFLRLVVHGLPEGKTVLSAFLPLGPAGQGGYAILLIGSSLKSLLPLTYGKSEILRASATGDTINVICLCMAIMLWSFATMWIIYALLVVLEVARKSQIPFNLSFWGLIFPNGPSFPSFHLVFVDYEPTKGAIL